MQLCDHEQEVTHADISPDGRLLATCGRDAKICIYKIGEFKKITFLNKMRENREGN